MSCRRRLGIAFAVSVALHAAAFALVLRRGVVPSRPPFVAIPVALVGRPGGGGGVAGDAAPATPPAAPAAPTAPALAPEPPAVARRPAASRSPKSLARAAEAPSPEPASPDTGSAGGAPSGGAPGGVAGGEGGGGDGSGGARVAYGTNPLPPYPLLARRLGKEGVVVLDVLVARDGRAAEVRVVRSSGFQPLDESAVTTVRNRWRFIPARRGGEAVESRVTVPIRFRLEDVSG